MDSKNKRISGEEMSLSNAYAKKKRSIMRNSKAQALRLLSVLVCCFLAEQSVAAIIMGKVYTREIVRNEQGLRTWVEYSPETGEQVAVLDAGESKYPGQSWRVMSADEYNHYKSHYQDLVERSKDKYELADPVGRATFADTEYFLADGETVLQKPTIQTGTAYLVVLPQEARFLNDPSSLVLAEYPFDPSVDHGVNESSLTMLINTDPDQEMGAIDAVTENRIAWQSAFLKDDQGNPISVDEGSSAGVTTTSWSNKEPVGPVQWVGVTSIPFAADITDENGQYVLTTVNDIFCPVPTFWSYLITADFQYRRFNPKNRGGSRGVYFKQRWAENYCEPLMVWVPWLGPIASPGFSTSMGGDVINNIDFPLEVSYLSGEARFATSPVVKGDRVELTPAGSDFFTQESETLYEAQDPDNEKTISEIYDFDNDGELDVVKLGHFEINEEGVETFVEDASLSEDLEQFQAVWFTGSDSDPNLDLPDITRLIDSKSFLNFDHEGLLSSISSEDVKNTDVYVVRVTDGRLISERLGLHESEAYGGSQLGEDGERGRFYYTQMVQGNAATFARPNALASQFTELQTRAGINPELHQREADHLKPGDMIRIYAINRSTGYMGSVETYLRGTQQDGNLSFPIEPILMGPPNLRIWAERDYEVKQGLQKGELREDQIIGFEGASLNSDKFVAIHTRWLDHHGRPIPESLKGAGYTGRLTNLSEDKALADSGSSTHQFDIEPGQNLQVLQLSSGSGLDNQHYYIHVSGEPSSGNPVFTGNDVKRVGEVDFSSTGINLGVLSARPDSYVPFMVPVFDEATTELQRQSYRQIRDDEELDESIREELEKPDPAYRWVYRPEMQYSNYGFVVDSLTLFDDDNQDGAPDSEEGVDITYDSSPILTPTDIVEMGYGLFLTELLPLDYLNAGTNKDLVLALGEQEIAISIEDGNVTFDNVEHLSLLSPDDFFSILLYANNDMANVLWEYSFEYLDVHPMVDVDDSRDENNVILVSADEPEVDIAADLVGYANRDESSKYDVKINWWVSDPGRLANYVDIDAEYAIFSNTLFMSRKAGTEYEVNARLLKDDGNSVSESLYFKVLPGKPSSIVAGVTGKSHVNAVGVSTIQFVVRDAHGNYVSDDTPIQVAMDGSVELSNPDQPIKIDNGHVKIDVVGAEYVETAAVTLTAGDVKQQAFVEILPLQIAIENFPSRVGVNTVHEGLVRVQDSDGSPVSNLVVSTYSEQGRVANRELKTDASGIAKFSYVAPQRSGDGVIKARVGFQPAAEYPFVIRFPSGEEPKLDTVQAIMIGDQQSAGIYEYTRYDGTPLAVGYEIDGQILVKGSAGEDVKASIGSLYQPNRQKLSALWTNGIETGGYPFAIKDEVGILEWKNHGVTVVDGAPLTGGRSYYFNGDTLSVTAADVLKRNGSIGFSLAINPDVMQGELINLGNAIRLDLLENGQLSLKVKGINQEPVSVLSELIPLGVWSEVAGHYHDGKLILSLNNKVFEADASGVLEFTTISAPGDETSDPSSYDMVVGRGYQGKLASLSWFALDSSPLVTFADGSEQSTISLDGSGQATVVVSSTGSMRGLNSSLSMQSIAFNASGERDAIKLISKELFEGMARVSIAGQLVTSAPPVDQTNGADWYLSNIENGIVFPEDIVFGNRAAFIPKAYAYDISFWDVASIVSSLIGLDSVEVIWDQMGNMIAERDVDIVAFSVAILDLLTLFPPAWPLKAVMAPAKVAIHTIKLVNPKAAKYLGGVIKRLYDKAKKRDFSLVFQGIAFFIVSAEMMTDPEAREGLKVMASTIDSTEDFLSWVEFFSLLDPEADGDSETSASTLEFDKGEALYGSMINELVPPAYAAVNVAKAIPLGRALQKLAPLIRSAGDDAAAAIRVFSRVAKENSDAARKLRKYFAREGALKGFFGIVRRGGLIKLRTWLLGYNGQRISPLAMFVIVGYLEDHFEDDINPLFSRGINEYERERNRNALNNLYLEAMPTLAPGSTSFSGISIAKAHGASYHLMQLALMHASSINVLGIEVQREIPVLATRKGVNSFKVGGSDVDWAASEPYIRRVDIVTGNEFYKDESWWEVKSWKAKSKSDRSPAFGIRKWTFLENKKQDGILTVAEYPDGDADAKGEAHKQFCLDRIAKKVGAYPNRKDASARGLTIRDETPPVINSIDAINWNFHDFTTGKNRDIVSPKKSKLEDALVVDPRNGGLFTGQSNNETDAKAMINVSAAQQLMELLQEKGRDLAEEALADLPELTE